MSKLITYHLNILENSTVTSTPAADADFPVYRLYDRRIGRLYKAGSIATTTIHIDQGATDIKEVDRLIIPANHNLDGLLINLQYSDNDADWTTAVGWSQSGSAIIEQSFTAATHRYWRLVVNSPSAVVQMHELFLTKHYEWDRNPEKFDRGIYKVYNTERKEDSGGRPRFIVFGDERRVRNYELFKIHEDDKTAVEALDAAWAGSKPFYLKDHDSVLIFGELSEPMNFSVTGGYADSPFSFLEVLP